MKRVAVAIALLAALSARADQDIESRVTEFKLMNGLEVIIYVDSSAPVVSTDVFYKVGGYDEQPGYTGLSHMLEHMSFKHTDIYSPGDFDRIVDSVGGNNNGFTSDYYTGFYEDFSSDRWEMALKIEAARMAKCIFPDSEFESEHQVVSEEQRLQENRPMSAFYLQFGAIATLVHPLRNPTIGWADDVKHFTVSAVRGWYQRRYNPANAVLVISGDVRPGDAKRKVEKYFGKLLGTPVERADFYNIEPKQNGERRLLMNRKVKVPQMLMAWHTPGLRDSNYVNGAVLAGILVQGRSSRLYKTLVTDSGLAVSVGGYSWVERDPDLLRIYITPKAESLIPRIEKLVDAEIEKARTGSASTREMQRVKNGVLAGQVFDRDDVSGMAYLLAASQILTGTWRDYKTYPERIKRVTKQQVQDFCKAYLTDDNRTTGILLPEKAEGR
jgi:zinc protease